MAMAANKPRIKTMTVNSMSVKPLLMIGAVLPVYIAPVAMSIFLLLARVSVRLARAGAKGLGIAGQKTERAFHRGARVGQEAFAAQTQEIGAVGVDGSAALRGDEQLLEDGRPARVFRLEWISHPNRVLGSGAHRWPGAGFAARP